MELTLRDIALLLAGFLAGLFVARLRRDAAARKTPPPGADSMALRETYVPPPAPPPQRPGAADEGDELNIPSRTGFYKRR